MENKIKIVNKEIIKPSSPTPIELREYKLCLFDQRQPVYYVPFLLFYDAKDKDKREFMSMKLKTSLSKTLQHYYPLAGRIRDNVVVECNDQGISFTETTVDACLSEVLQMPDAHVLREFLPRKVVLTPEAVTGFLLLVQANFFHCGGLVIGMCISHKVADATTLFNFTNAWAGIACGDPNVVPPPILTASAVVPPLDSPIPPIEVESSKCVSRRYVIDSSNIATLKEKAASNIVPNPTSVEVVMSLIWNCAAKAFRANHRGSDKQLSVLAQSMNLRRRLNPTLPDTLVGNIVAQFFADETEELEFGPCLQASVANIRKGREDFHRLITEKFDVENKILAGFEVYKQSNRFLNKDNRPKHYYIGTSWCKAPLYEIDFGWGTPIWVTTVGGESKHLIILMDTKDADGIQVLLTLSEESMTIFEKDQAILEFARFNPKIL